ncbi:PAAR domain-containing protein [Silvimonas amylolytica]|uniref:PAAR domain-containing protein n=1 Tax=Silvimonas amylolytica TaxID=449663 RepID=UPI001E41B976|nr:PAAR domain-containing protein [Silvimonas amylolytica]
MSDIQHDHLPEVARATLVEKARIDALPVIAQICVATLGARTRAGGVVTTANSSLTVDGHRVAAVGDQISCSDGRVARVIEGAGSSMFIFGGSPVALIGSRADNGDAIISSLQQKLCLTLRAGHPFPAGLFDQAFRSEPQT